ncbi:trypsin beta-like [Anopheles nili]|uniref:trypsin beta-like n=1 Tax=Anopheles nili TaxID=185578 RepID=UPI00237B7ABB|nr:trypsin beta-like [Anopheles nili]
MNQLQTWNHVLSVLLCLAALQVETNGQTPLNHTIPVPFNNTLNATLHANQTLPSNDLPPLATTAKWEPIPRYKHPHYDTSGKLLWFPRIIGGLPATAGEFPAMVSLQLTQNSAHVCGGTLLTMSDILTAAHCVTDVRGVAHPATQYQVMADDLNIQSMMPSPLRQIRRVRSITIHPQYDPATITHDLAIVRVDTAFRRTDTLYAGKRIQKSPMLGDRCHLAGWGVTNENSQTMSPNLQRINVVISDFGSCNVAYGHILTNGMLCAGAPGRDACQGDSGGALLCSGGRVAGVVSFGAGCANNDIPGVYVDVAHYEKWINGALKNGAQRPNVAIGSLAGVIVLFWMVAQWGKQ